MKIKNGFVLRDVGGQAVVIAVGEASKTFHGMINLNATGKEIWQGIESGLDVDQMVEKMVETYEVEPDKASQLQGDAGGEAARRSEGSNDRRRLRGQGV